MRKVEYLTSKLGQLLNYFQTSISEGSSYFGFNSATNASEVVQSGCQQFDRPIRQAEDLIHKKPKRSQRVRPNGVSQDVTNELLLKCLRTIPKEYFENDLPKLDMISRNRRETQEEHERLSYFLSQVDICIYHQVTLNQGKFFKALMAIEAMDDLIDANVDRLQQVRQNNRLIHQKIVEEAHKVKMLVIKQKNLQALIGVAESVRTYSKAKKCLKEGTTSTEDESATELITKLRSSRPSYQRLKSTRNIESVIKALSSEFVDELSQGFAQKLLRAITKQEQDAEQSMFWERMSLLAQTANQQLILSGEVLDDIRPLQSPDAPVPEELFAVASRVAEVCQLNIQPSTHIINMHFNTSFGDFLYELKNFCVSRLQNQFSNAKSETLQVLLSRMSLFFFRKITVFYIDKSRRFVVNLVRVARQLVERLAPSKYSGFDSRLSEIIQFAVEIASENVVRLCNLKGIEWAEDVQNAIEHIEAMQKWEVFVCQQLPMLLKQGSISSKRIANQWTEAVKLNTLRPCLSQIASRFFTSLHKQQLTVEMKEIFESERWTCIDIPVDLYITLSRLLGRSQGKSKNKSRMFDGSFYADNSPQIRKDRSAFVKVEELAATNHQIRVVKDECRIDDQRFKLTETFLLLLQIMDQYLELGLRCSFLRDEVATKLPELIRYYNSQSCQLILGAGAVMFPKFGQKSVTSRHLCVCATTLEFLMLLVKRIHLRFPLLDERLLTKGISDHHNQIIENLKVLLQTRIQNCIPNVDMKSQPTKGTQEIISSVRTLFDIVDEYLSAESIARIFDWEIFVRFLARIRKLNDHYSASLLRLEVVYYFNELEFLSRVIPDFVERKTSTYTSLAIK